MKTLRLSAIFIVLLSFTAPMAFAGPGAMAGKPGISKERIIRLTSELKTQSREFRTLLRRSNLRRGLRIKAKVLHASIKHFELTLERRNLHGFDIDGRPVRVLTAYKNITTNFRRLRAAMHKRASVPSSQVLDEWYDVAFAFRKLDKKVSQSQLLTRRPRPLPSLQFRGKINGGDVVFTGATHAAVHKQCTRFLRPNIFIRSLEVNNVTHRKKFGHWTPSEACAFAALNSSVKNAKTRARLNAKIGRTPIQVKARTTMDLNRAVKSLVPLAAPQGARRVSLQNRSYKKRMGRWSSAAIVSIFLNKLDAQQKPLISQGQIDDVPFFLGATSHHELNGACLSYLAKLSNGDRFRTISVNGVDRKTYGASWSRKQACMIVTSFAKSA